MRSTKREQDKRLLREPLYVCGRRESGQHACSLTAAFSCLEAVEFPGGDYVVVFLSAWILKFVQLFFAGDLPSCLQVAFLTAILDLLVG